MTRLLIAFVVFVLLFASHSLAVEPEELQSEGDHWISGEDILFAAMCTSLDKAQVAAAMAGMSLRSAYHRQNYEAFMMASEVEHYRGSDLWCQDLRIGRRAPQFKCTKVAIAHSYIEEMRMVQVRLIACKVDRPVGVLPEGGVLYSWQTTDLSAGDRSA